MTFTKSDSKTYAYVFNHLEANNKKINTTGKSNLKILNKCPNFKHDLEYELEN